MQDNFYLVLMAGGSGTRLWPVSRQNMPKQFHKLSGEKSLILDTYDRIKDLVPKENIYISLGTSNLAETKKQLPEVPGDNYIVEPMGKNTAPAIALITAKIFKTDPQAIIGIISSDHTVKNAEEYRSAFSKSKNFITKHPEYLVTIGITPDNPNTGYGYIKVGDKFTNEPVNAVEEFVEKPNLETAERYIKSGNYLWNGGYFIFRADSMIKMFEELTPEIYAGLKDILKAIDTPNEDKVVKEVFEKYEKVPIDTAIAEKVKNIAVVPMDCGWSDVGSWASLYDVLSESKGGNVSKGHHIGMDNKNCLFFAQDRLLATVGLEDIIVVDTPDVTLVCHKNKSQEIKELLEKVKKEGKERYL